MLNPHRLATVAIGTRVVELPAGGGFQHNSTVVAVLPECVVVERDEPWLSPAEPARAALRWDEFAVHPLPPSGSRLGRRSTMPDASPANPEPIGTIVVDRDAGVDAAIRLAPDPQNPYPWASIALVNRTRPGPVGGGRLCVIQLPGGPMLRRVTRRGDRLLLRSRSGRWAGSAPADVPLIPVLRFMGDVQ